MEHTFKELKKMTAAQLKEVAAGIEHEAVEGYTQLNKDHLLKALCDALGIDMHEHHIAQRSDKAKIKAKIKDLKTRRDEAMAAHNHNESKLIRRKIHNLKRTLPKTAV